MLELRPNQIDLWLAFTDDIRDKHLLDQYRKLLTDKEQEQELRFHFSKDQHRYLVTRALIRTVLSRYAPVAPEHWAFSTNAYGKPEIANDDRLAQKISFNISHTQGLIVLGITSDNPLGVDTENVRGRQAPIDVARSFFSADEVAALCALPVDKQHDHFFQYWTLKEAYIKARGMGLSIPLDQFSFHLQPDVHPGIAFHSLMDDRPSRWRFWQFRVAPEYLMAICVDRTESAAQQLNIKKIMPLAEEEMFDCTLLRESV